MANEPFEEEGIRNMAYPREEHETSLLYVSETGEWRFYSTVPKHIRKLSTIADIEILETEDDGQTPKAVRGTLKEKTGQYEANQSVDG